MRQRRGRFNAGLVGDGFDLGNVEPSIDCPQGRPMNAVEDPAGGEVHTDGPGNVSAKRIPDRENPIWRQVKLLEHGLIDCGVRLSEGADIAAKLRIANSKRA